MTVYEIGKAKAMRYARPKGLYYYVTILKVAEKMLKINEKTEFTVYVDLENKSIIYRKKEG